MGKGCKAVPGHWLDVLRFKEKEKVGLVVWLQPRGVAQVLGQK